MAELRIGLEEVTCHFADLDDPQSSLIRLHPFVGVVGLALIGVLAVTTEPQYRPIDLGTYPGIVRDESHGLAIFGKLFEVEDCALDEFEGSPDHYSREVIAVAGIEGPVEAYFYRRFVPEGARSGAAWPFD